MLRRNSYLHWRAVMAGPARTRDRKKSPTNLAATAVSASLPALIPIGQSYLQRILNAKVYDVAIETPLTPAKNLSKRLANKVLLKREDDQPVFSFKLRGAYNKMVHLTPAQRALGVICASAGNHAQGVALSAKKLGCRAVIV
eukprot:Opistho-1_new@31804